MFGRGFFFFKMLMFFLFIGVFVLACGGLYNLGFTRGFTQGLVVSGTEATNLAPFPGFYPGSYAGPGPFLAILGIFALGFLVLAVLGAIFGRRWSKRKGRHWRYHYYRNRPPRDWGDPGWEDEFPPDDAESIKSA